MIARYTNEQIQMMMITELEFSIVMLKKRNAILTELAANKDAYADQLRQELNRLRAGHPEVKATNGCDGCRYLGTTQSLAPNALRLWKCEAFDFAIYNGRPAPCNHGPYLPRCERCNGHGFLSAPWLRERQITCPQCSGKTLNPLDHEQSK